VAKMLEAAGWQEGGLGFSRASATVLLVCGGWKAVYDALVRRLVLRRDTTDEAMGMLVLRFPAVASLEFKGDTWGVLTDDGLRAVSSLPALTELDLSHSNVTAQALLALRNLRTLTAVRERDGSWRAGAPQHHRRSEPAHQVLPRPSIVLDCIANTMDTPRRAPPHSSAVAPDTQLLHAAEQLTVHASPYFQAAHCRPCAFTSAFKSTRRQKHTSRECRTSQGWWRRT
jgi:hypothetical protein